MSIARVIQHMDTQRVDVWMGRERVTLSEAQFRDAAYMGNMERIYEQLYDAAKRDVRASMSPLERAPVKTVRVGNRVRLVK